MKERIKRKNTLRKLLLPTYNKKLRRISWNNFFLFRFEAYRVVKIYLPSIFVCDISLWNLFGLQSFIYHLKLIYEIEWNFDGKYYSWFSFFNVLALMDFVCLGWPVRNLLLIPCLPKIFLKLPNFLRS